MAIHANYRELNTELAPEQLPSGTATVATNVTIHGSRLEKRRGFARGAGAGVVVAYQNSDGTVHTRDAPGWFYEWANRTYFTSSQGSLHSESSAGAPASGIKAGLPRPSTGTLQGTESGGTKGGKEGEYRFCFSVYDSVTQEESVVSGTQLSTEPEEVRASAGGTSGALSITSISLPDTSPGEYSFDQIRIYCSNGNTERLFNPVASYEMYLEQTKASATSATITMPDHVHGTPSSPRYTNAGGEPPACTVGAFDGTTAVYFTGTLIEFSIPNFPTMIPRRQTYTLTGNNLDLGAVIEPLPWNGSVASTFDGTPNAAIVVGGSILAFTDNHTYIMSRSGDGRMAPRMYLPNVGCRSSTGAITTGSTAYILNNKNFWKLGPDGLQGLVGGHWRPTLDSINTATAVIAYYSYLDQIWIDSPGDGLYVIDASTGRLISKWTGGPCGTAVFMLEVSTAGSTPVMIVYATGFTWSYDPEAAVYDDNSVAFAAEWTGWFGQETSGKDKFLEMVTVAVGTLDGGQDLTIGVAGVQHSSETNAQTTTTTTDSETGLYRFSTEFDGDRYGRLFKLSITSPASVGMHWAIENLVVRFGGS